MPTRTHGRVPAQAYLGHPLANAAHQQSRPLCARTKKSNHNPFKVAAPSGSSAWLLARRISELELLLWTVAKSCTTLKPRENIVCWHLITSQSSFEGRWCRILSIHSMSKGTRNPRTDLPELVLPDPRIGQSPRTPFTRDEFRAFSAACSCGRSRRSDLECSGKTVAGHWQEWSPKKKEKKKKNDKRKGNVGPSFNKLAFDTQGLTARCMFREGQPSPFTLFCQSGLIGSAITVFLECIEHRASTYKIPL